MKHLNLRRLGFSIDEIVEMTGLSRQSVYGEINSNRLHTYKVGRRRFASQHALEAWVRDREKETA